MGWRSTFTTADNLVIFQEVAAAKANLASFGDIDKRFNTVATITNANPNLFSKVSYKRLQNRYKKIMTMFERGDPEECMMFGVVGEAEEMENLLSFKLGAQKHLEVTRDADKAAKCEVRAGEVENGP